MGRGAGTGLEIEPLGEAFFFARLFLPVSVSFGLLPPPERGGAEKRQKETERDSRKRLVPARDRARMATLWHPTI